ncbi:MAG TPA: YdcF family protein [Aquifex sp.]|nr:YdcF family protein [Aquifex sp.]
MFFLKKLITYFVLLPPGNLVLFLLVLGFYLIKKGVKFASYITLAVGFALYFLSTEVGASLLISPLEESFKVPPKEIRDSCQYLVLLGGGVKRGAPFLELKNDLNGDSFKRAVGAYLLYRQKPRKIVASGYSVRESHPEGLVIKDLLVSLGVEKGDIIAEDRSRDTFENALFVAKLVGTKKVCLITSAYHMRRAVHLFSKAGVKNLVPIPVDFKTSKAPFTVYKLFPTSYWLNISSKALKEYLGLLYYSLR